jgi:hypothetical protein
VRKPKAVAAAMIALRMTTRGRLAIIPNTIPHAACPLLLEYRVMSGWIATFIAQAPDDARNPPGECHRRVRESLYRPMDRPAENFDLDAEPTEGTDDEEQGQ